MRNAVEEVQQAREDRDEQRDLEGAVARLVVDPEDLGLDSLGLAGEERLELGVAHHLGVVLERVGDLLLLCRRDHRAGLGHVRERERRATRA